MSLFNDQNIYNLSQHENKIRVGLNQKKKCQTYAQEQYTKFNMYNRRLYQRFEIKTNAHPQSTHEFIYSTMLHESSKTSKLDGGGFNFMHRVLFVFSLFIVCLRKVFDHLLKLLQVVGRKISVKSI